MKKILISLVLIFMATSVYGDTKTTYLICKGEFSELWHDKKKIYFDKNGGNAQITIQYRFESDKKDYGLIQHIFLHYQIALTMMIVSLAKTL